MLFCKHFAKGLLFFLNGALIFVFSHSQAQFTENFEDNDLSVNPPWTGNTEDFIQENNQLRLLAADAGSSYLVTRSEAIENATWQWTVEMLFNPSGSNYSEFYVVLDDSTIHSEASGYMVRVGGTSDEVSLFEVTGGTATEIIDGADKRLDLSNPVLNVRLSRDSLGEWRLYSKLNSEPDYIFEGSTTNTTHELSSYFGFKHQYTSTRADKFFVDNIIVQGVPVKDRTPPQLLEAVIKSANELQLYFSEEINATAFEPRIIVNSEPSQIIEQDSNYLLARIDGSFKNGQYNSIVISNIADQIGNISPDSTFNIFYFQETETFPGDVVISEIMADPNPAVELPPVEFLELYNVSDEPKNLKGWILSDASGQTQLDSIILQPHDYLILTANSSISELSNFGNTLGVSNWPTLNNQADQLTLYDKDGQLIHRVSYLKSWYGSEIKQEGGWSLEIIDPENSCGEELNWLASEDENGGTPGNVNSIFAHKPDQMPPDLVEVYVAPVNMLKATFNERIDTNLVTTIKVVITPEIEVKSIAPSDETGRILDIELTSAPTPSTKYSISFLDVTDCNGNVRNETTSVLLIPEDAEEGDIIVNEVLFNPKEDGVDFVELYNTSSKVIDLSGWEVSNPDTDSEARIAPSVILPGQIVALTTDKQVLMNDYPLHADSALRESSLPTLNNDEGYVVLKNSSGMMIDSIFYEESMHIESVVDPNGVSLERLDPFSSGMLKSNWFSAAETVGFATPGFTNSQRSSENFSNTSSFEITPRVFSPDADGYQDFCELQYSLDQTGLIGTLKLYRLNGSLATTLASNELLSDTGRYIWDGRTDRGIEAIQGTYIVIFEVFSTDGYRQIFKDKVSIAGM